MYCRRAPKQPSPGRALVHAEVRLCGAIAANPFIATSKKPTVRSQDIKHYRHKLLLPASVSSQPQTSI